MAYSELGEYIAMSIYFAPSEKYLRGYRRRLGVNSPSCEGARWEAHLKKLHAPSPHEGRDQFGRFSPGEAWLSLPSSCQAPNRGMRLRPKNSVYVKCWQCGHLETRFRKSARYCSVPCRRRAQLVRDRQRAEMPTPLRRGSRKQVEMSHG